MISFFSVFEVMEPQGDYIEDPYDPGEYKFTWILIVTFPTLHDYFIYIKHATLMKYILDYCELPFFKNVC